MRSNIIRSTFSGLLLITSTAAFAAGTGHAMGASQRTHAATPTAHPTTLGPARTGQPNQSCELTPNTPGNSATAPGSAFNPSGRAGTVYAGEQPQNSRNTASVSQYDVACARSH
jgi:hypothetical protein